MAKKRSPPESSVTAINVTSVDQHGNLAYTNESNGSTKPMVVVNFKAVAGPEPRKAGNYEGRLVSHKLELASATSGQPIVNLQWDEISDGESTSNRKMFKTYSLQPKALFAIKRDLIRMGADIEYMNSEECDIDEVIHSLYGTVSTIKYGEPREYKDKDGNDKVGDNFIEVVDPAKL